MTLYFSAHLDIASFSLNMHFNRVCIIPVCLLCNQRIYICLNTSILILWHTEMAPMLVYEYYHQRVGPSFDTRITLYLFSSTLSGSGTCLVYRGGSKREVVLDTLRWKNWQNDRSRTLSDMNPSLYEYRRLYIVNYTQLELETVERELPLIV